MINPFKRIARFAADVIQEYRDIKKTRKFHFDLKYYLPEGEYDKNYAFIQTIPIIHYECFMHLLFHGFSFDKSYEIVGKVFEITSKASDTDNGFVESIREFEKQAE